MNGCNKGPLSELRHSYMLQLLTLNINFTAIHELCATIKLSIHEVSVRLLILLYSF
jgi:hypothetical protein